MALCMHKRDKQSCKNHRDWNGMGHTSGIEMGFSRLTSQQMQYHLTNHATFLSYNQLNETVHHLLLLHDTLNNMLLLRLEIIAQLRSLVLVFSGSGVCQFFGNYLSG